MQIRTPVTARECRGGNHPFIQVLKPRHDLLQDLSPVFPEVCVGTHTQTASNQGQSLYL